MIEPRQVGEIDGNRPCDPAIPQSQEGYGNAIAMEVLGELSLNGWPRSAIKTVPLAMEPSRQAGYRIGIICEWLYRHAIHPVNIQTREK
jgi:hypothetical protein